MLVYNVTIKVAEQVAHDWLNWLQNEHIPEVMATGCFSKAGVFRLLEDAGEEGVTYVVQYFAGSRELYDRYMENHAGILRKKSFEKWGDKFIAFRSLMQVVN